LRGWHIRYSPDEVGRENFAEIWCEVMSWLVSALILTHPLSFDNNRNMKLRETLLPASQERELPESGHNASEFLITDAVLAEIKKQSTGGCLLCVIDNWAEDDWE
jgi:hypothetical protein